MLISLFGWLYCDLHSTHVGHTIVLGDGGAACVSKWFKGRKVPFTGLAAFCKLWTFAKIKTTKKFLDWNVENLECQNFFKWILYSTHWDVMMKVLLKYEFINNVWIDESKERQKQKYQLGVVGINCLVVHLQKPEMRW